MIYPFLSRLAVLTWGISWGMTLSGQSVPCELGQVQWSRDLEKSQTISRESGRPLLILFQEIPGCQTCQDFGNGPLSHPLLVEAIEDLFIPVLVYNNHAEDSATLHSFQEPAWNNPVIRLVNSELNDLIERRDGVWETPGVAERMKLALKAARQPIPAYLELLAAPRNTGLPEHAAVAMHCFWEGEAAIGGVPGVLATNVGFRDGQEVVEFEFDPAQVDFINVLQQAQKLKCASVVFASSPNQAQVAKQLELPVKTALNLRPSRRGPKIKSITWLNRHFDTCR